MPFRCVKEALMPPRVGKEALLPPRVGIPGWVCLSGGYTRVGMPLRWVNSVVTRRRVPALGPQPGVRGRLRVNVVVPAMVRMGEV